MTDTVEQADRLSRGRARILPVLAIAIIAQQATFINTLEHGVPTRAVDIVRLGGWVVMVVFVLLMLITGGSWLRRRGVRALMNDEVTRANRSSAMACGFVVAVLTGMVAFVVAMYRVTDARVAIHVIVSTALAAALLRFGALERRAHKAG